MMKHKISLRIFYTRNKKIYEKNVTDQKKKKRNKEKFEK